MITAWEEPAALTAAGSSETVIMGRTEGALRRDCQGNPTQTFIKLPQGDLTGVSRIGLTRSTPNPRAEILRSAWTLVANHPCVH